jgi:hypothetical protein
MLSLEVYQDQLEYVGLFAAPVFGLLSQREKVVSGLYYAFLGLHSGLADFQVEGEGAGGLAETIAVNLTDRGTYRFSSERVEWTFSGPGGRSELDGSVLDRGNAWLRSTVPSVAFKEHFYTYFAHAWVIGGSAREFLIGLNSPHLHGFGENQGTGLIFHADFPDHGWSVQITIDHSNVAADGLFVQILAVVSADQVDHQQTAKGVDRLLRDSLERLGLMFTPGVG